MTDTVESKVGKFNLRVVPWWTDGCSTFLNNLFKWFPASLKREPTALEFGGGNSTLYLLSKGAKVVTIESNDVYLGLIKNITENAGFRPIVISANEFNVSLFGMFDVIIIKAVNIEGTGNILNKFSWDIVINDGISRREVLEEIYDGRNNTILILDNVEYCANWGRLDRSSAKPGLIKAYRALLRDKNWRHYIFEQAEGRDGRGVADKSGWESPHRWISAVIWPEDHLLAKMMVSNIGMPIVNELGIDDSDTQTLNERCPFDWNEMKWLREPFPEELDLKLGRSYD